MCGALDVSVIDFAAKDESFTAYREVKIVSKIDNSLDVVPPLVPSDPSDFMHYSGELTSIQMKKDIESMYVEVCLAET